MSAPKHPSPSPAAKSDNMGVIHRIYQSVHKSIHFDRGYNFSLFVILAGALMGFTLARLQYLSIDGIFVNETIPSDALHYARPGAKRTAIILHLAAILPAAFLVCVRFAFSIPTPPPSNSTLVPIRPHYPPQIPPLPPPQRLHRHPPPLDLLRRRMRPHPHRCRRPTFHTSRHRLPHRRQHHLRHPCVHQHQAPSNRPASRMDAPHLGVRR
jgi:hypothetical protein